MSSPDNKHLLAATLVGGGPWSKPDLAHALARAPRLFAADSGANRLVRQGQRPEAVFGDLDSLDPQAAESLGEDRLCRFAEQITTDFDKSLRSIDAPFVLGLGFLGGRTDHTLAALNSLVRHGERPCLLIGPKDITFAAPPRPLVLSLRQGDCLSLFPLAAISGQSKGLRWPITDLAFAPGSFIGTSNEVAEDRVELDFDGPGMLITLPRRRLDAAIAALCRNKASRRHQAALAVTSFLAQAKGNRKILKNNVTAAARD